MNALQVLLTICRRILLRTSIVVALGIGLPASTQASDQAELNSAPFPASDITLVVPFGEGGATDVLFRAIAEQAQTYLEVPVTPINMPGNGATLGSQLKRRPLMATLCLAAIKRLILPTLMALRITTTMPLHQWHY